MINSDSNNSKITILIATLGAIAVVALAAFVIVSSLYNDIESDYLGQKPEVISSSDKNSTSVSYPERNPCGIKKIIGKINYPSDDLDLKMDFDLSHLTVHASNLEFINGKMNGACSRNYLVVRYFDPTDSGNQLKCIFQGDINGDKVSGFYSCSKIQRPENTKPLWQGKIYQ